MKKILVFSLSFMIFSQCDSSDKKFCDCIKASEEFNHINAEILAGKIDNTKLIKAKKLLTQKRKLCFDYKNTVGDELLQKKRSCQ